MAGKNVSRRRTKRSTKTADLDQVIELARRLPREEQMRLRALLDVWVARPIPSNQLVALTEEEIDEELLAEGVLDHVPPPRSKRPMRPEHPPISIKGKPLSETLIEERR
jgi:hypothetical protein